MRVEGLLGNFLAYKGKYDFNDFDEVVQSGIWTLYDIKSSHLHSPGIQYGILEVIATNDNFIAQKAYSLGSEGSFKIRTRTDLNVWSGWNTIGLLDNFLAYKGKYDFNDFDEVVQNGIWTLYDIKPSHLHSPGIQYGILEVIATSDNFIAQKAYSLGSEGSFKIRTRTDLNVWSGWNTIGL